MSQRKEKYIRNAMAQYGGIVEDVDDLKLRVGALEANRDKTARMVKETGEMVEMMRRWAEAEERKKTRAAKNERRRRACRRRVLALVLLALALLALAVVATRAAMAARPDEDVVLPAAVEAVADALPVVRVDQLQAVVAPMEGEDPLEDQKIEAALLAQGYLSDEVPLTYTEQDLLRTACEEFGIPYEVALALVEKETHFQNVAGDDGASVGYMQVQERYHGDRMARLGVTDLWDPAGNFRVALDYLAELLEDYGDLTMALMAYNAGPTGAAQAWAAGVYETQYTRDILAGAEAWAEVLG